MRYILILWFALWLSPVLGQNPFVIKLKSGDNNQASLKNIVFKSELKDSSAVSIETEKIISQLQRKGYFLAGIQAIEFRNKEAIITINSYEAFRWLKLSKGNLSLLLLNKLNLKPTTFQQKNFDINQLESVFDKIIRYFENNGYPFASIQLDSIKFENNQISAALKLNIHQQIIIDKINLVGTGELSQTFLQNYLSVFPNQLYQENQIINIDTRIKELPYLTQTHATELRFNQDKASVYIYVNKKDANQFDGLIGFQQKGNSNKISLVGNLNLSLLNIFKRGEELQLKYQSFAQESQSLNLKTSIPHIFNTNFAFIPSFELFKQDTSYLNTNTRLGINYSWKSRKGIDLYYENKNSRLLSVSNLQTISQLPPILDATTNFYGISLNLEQLDYRTNPSKGYQFLISTAIGDRNIKRNASIPPLLYEHIKMQSTAIRLFSKADFYLPLAKQLILAITNQNAYINSSNILENEVFRLGGQKTLRGFDELSILTNAYVYGNLELRYLLDTNSFLAIFYNQAAVHLKTNILDSVDYPLGLGAGVNIETTLGILSLSYAIGKQRNIPLNLQRGKIHFGISTTF